MKYNHLNQFTTTGYTFLFESCIHFSIDSRVKHILVTEGKRSYDFLDQDDILKWKLRFKEQL